jgi:hypothetical protein
VYPFNLKIDVYPFNLKIEDVFILEMDILSGRDWEEEDGRG